MDTHDVWVDSTALSTSRTGDITISAHDSQIYLTDVRGERAVIIQVNWIG